MRVPPDELSHQVRGPRGELVSARRPWLRGSYWPELHFLIFHSFFYNFLRK